MSILAGKITNLKGLVKAVNPETGEYIVLKEGSEVFLNDLIVTAKNGSVTIDFESGETLMMGRSSEVKLSEEIIGAVAQLTEEGATEVDIAALQQAVLEGNFDMLEAPAAGGEAVSSSLASADSVLERTAAQGEITSGYQTRVLGASTAETATSNAVDNIAPVFEDEFITVTEDSVVSGQLQFTDPEGGVVTIRLADGVALPAGLTLNPDGSYVFDADSYDSLAVGETTTFNLPVIATDNQGLETPAVFTINVSGTNDTPNAEDASFSAGDNQVEFSLGAYTSDIEDDRSISDLMETQVRITSLPEYGDLFVGTQQLAIGDMVYDAATIRYEVDASKVDNFDFNATTDFKDAGYSNNSVSSFTTANGILVSGGIFSGDTPDSSSTLSAANLYYDNANREKGLGVGGDREINSSNKEYIAVEFPQDVVSSTVSFGSVYGNYQDSHRADAQINIIALKDGQEVYEVEFNDTYDKSGIFEAPVIVEGGYDELRVFTLADRNSNITLQGVEVESVPVDDHFGYEAVDAEGATEAGTVSLSSLSGGTLTDSFLWGDENQVLADVIDISSRGETYQVENFDVSEDTLNISGVVDNTVTENNLDQYLSLAKVDSDGDGVDDSTLLTIDSNGDKAGGDLTYVTLQDALDDELRIEADNDAKGTFDIDD